MQSYDPNQPQSHIDGYYQQSQNQQQRISLPPASSFFDTGHQPPPGYHHSNTPQSEPPPSPFLTGHYNQPPSYPSTDPNTPYMHSSVISPPTYNSMGPPPPHFPPMQPMYDPSQNIDHSGYGGMEQHPRHLQPQQPLPPQPHHQMPMGYPPTSMMPQEHPMQMGYMPSPMDQGVMMGPYPQHQGFSHMPPPPHHQPAMHPPQMMQLPPPQRPHHSIPDQTPTTTGGQHLEMSNNSILRNHLRQQPQQPHLSTMQEPVPPQPSSTMESIVPPSDNMSQILQMQQQQNSSQQQRREATNDASNLMSLQSSNYMPPPPQSLINREMDPNSGYNGPMPFQRQYSQPQSVYSNPGSNYGQEMGPPQIMTQRSYHEPIQQDYHRANTQSIKSQSSQNNSQMPDFSKITEPPQVASSESSPTEEKPLCADESSIAATVAEVVAKQSARSGGGSGKGSAASSPSTSSKKRRYVRSFESIVESIIGDSDKGPTVKQHLQAQQHEKRMQEQQEKILTKIKEDEEKRKTKDEEINEQEVADLITPSTTSSMEVLKGPGMTRTEFLQAHRHRKSDSQPSEAEKNEKDTVTRIIEEIAGKNFENEKQNPEIHANKTSGEDGSSQLADEDRLHDSILAVEDGEENSEASTSQPKPKPKRIRKRPQRETKVQKENKMKFLFKCVHLQKTIRSLILKNSALADETSRLFYRIKNVTEERKLLAKRLQHYERNRIRRIQTQKKKKAKAEAQLASIEQTFLQEIQQEPGYQASVEIIENQEFSEKLEAYPFDKMMHKEMAVYMPPLNDDYAQIPYLDNSNYNFEGFQEATNNANHSHTVYNNNMPSDFNNFPNSQLRRQEGSKDIFSAHQIFDQNDIQIFNTENDDNNSPQSSSFFDQPISRSETPRETPNSSSAASSRPHSSLSGQIKKR